MPQTDFLMSKTFENIKFPDMKKIFFALLAILSAPLRANDLNFTDHSKIKELSDFAIMGTFDLRTEKDISSPVKYRSINHEGGMNVRVLEILEKDIYKNQKGQWFYVLLTKPIWTEDGEWLEKYRKFLIFLPDETPIFNFRE